MSLESNVQDLTKAINRLCDLIESKQLPLPFTPPATPEPAPQEQPKAEKSKAEKKADPKPATPEPKAEKKATPEPKAEKKAEPAPTPEPTPAPQEEQPEAGGDTPTITLSDLRGVGSMVIKAGKAKQMRELIASHEAESLTTLDPKHYTAVMAGLKKLAAGE